MLAELDVLLIHSDYVHCFLVLHLILTESDASLIYSRYLICLEYLFI